MNPRLKKAMRLHRSGALNEAASLYVRVLRIEPENPTALHFYGVLKHTQGDSERAVRLIRKALDHDPDYLAAYQNLGNIHFESDDVSLAEACYRALLDRDATNIHALNNLSTALRCQNRLEESEECARRACSIDPESRESWYNLGRSQQVMGRRRDAIRSLVRAVEIDPSFSMAYSALCRETYLLEMALGRTDLEATREAYRNWRSVDPGNPVCEFMAAAVEQDPGMERAPDAFVKRLFDDFAASFERKLASIDYRVPDLMREEIEHRYPRAAADLEVLDAGCGTGLISGALRPWSRSLTGVDLSAGMLGRARLRNVYDELVEAELTAYLEENPSRFDLVVCADTLCYFGDLGRVLDALAGTLKPGGRAVFTVEHLVEGSPGFRLNANGRYSHAGAYVEQCLAGAGCELESVREESLRREAGEDVHGLLFTVCKP